MFGSSIGCDLEVSIFLSPNLPLPTSQTNYCLFYFIIFYYIRQLLAGSPQQHDANYCGLITVLPPMRVPYSLRTVCEFFNVPQNLYMQALWDGAYSLSSLSEKTRKSNRLQMSIQRQHFLLSYLKTLSVGPAGTWTSGSLSADGPYPTELTGRHLIIILFRGIRTSKKCKDTWCNHL